MYLKLMPGYQKIPVGATDGKLTFLSSKFFTGRVYGQTLSSPSMRPTLATHFAIYELVKDGTFQQIFDSPGELGSFEWEESQVVEIVQKPENRRRLNNRGLGTFFRIKGGGVVFIGVDGDFCDAHVEPLTFPLTMLVKDGPIRFALPSIV